MLNNQTRWHQGLEEILLHLLDFNESSLKFLDGMTFDSSCDLNGVILNQSCEMSLDLLVSLLNDKNRQYSYSDQVISQNLLTHRKKGNNYKGNKSKNKKQYNLSLEDLEDCNEQKSRKIMKANNKIIIYSFSKNKKIKFGLHKVSPAIFNMSEAKNDQYLIYGGLYLNLNIMKGKDNPMRENDQDVVDTQYFQKKGVLILSLKERGRSHKDLSGIIKLITSINDESVFKSIADNMDWYQSWIWQDVQMQQMKLNYLQKNNLIDTYHKQYEQFESWALEKIKNINGHSQYYSFTILKFDLNSLEVQTQKAGYSSALLNLRGVSLTDTNQVFSKKSYFFLDRMTCLGFIMKLLKNTIFSSVCLDSPNLLTFDELYIPFQSVGQTFNNRSENYPYYCSQIQMPENSMPEFHLNVKYYQFSYEDLMKVVNIRSSRSALDDALYENYSKSSYDLPNNLVKHNRIQKSNYEFED